MQQQQCNPGYKNIIIAEDIKPAIGHPLFNPYDSMKFFSYTSYVDERDNLIRLNSQDGQSQVAIVPGSNCTQTECHETSTAKGKACKEHLTKKFKCTVVQCPKLFRTTHERTAHLTNVHTAPVPCPWEDCTKVVQPAGLTQHIKNVHEKVKEDCKYCGKEVLKSRIYIHQKICANGGERKHPCPIDGCTKTFRTIYEQTAHTNNVHTRPVKCTFKDCKKLVKQSSLAQHLKNKHGINDLKQACPHCHKQVVMVFFEKHLKNCKGAIS